MVIRQGPQAVTDAGRRAGQLLAVLADEYGHLVRAAVLGKPRGRPTSAAALKSAEISVSVAITVFPDDIYRAPESWARRAYPNLVYFNEVDRGGHFAAWEQPQLFSEEMRAAFKTLR